MTVVTTEGITTAVTMDATGELVVYLSLTRLNIN